MVENDKFAVLLMLYLILRTFGHNINIVVHYDNKPFWISTVINEDDLECPIHLKVCLADSTLDIHMLSFTAYNARLNEHGLCVGNKNVANEL